MKGRLTLLVTACTLPLLALAVVSYVAEPCCGVIGVDAAKGTVAVRNNFTGRVMQIKSADLAKSLKVGDALDADAGMGKIVSIKGVAQTVPLQEPDSVEPCCGVVAVVKDRLAMQALLGGVFAEPRGGIADPATPISDLRGKIRGIDATNGIQADFGSVLDGAEPIGAIVIARNNATGAMHALNMSVLASDGLSQTSAPITSSVKIGDPISIDVATGIATLKSGTGSYAFNLRGIKKGAEPIAGIKGPWVVEPDPKAQGRFGIVRTNWHEKVGSGYQNIFVYLPGKRDASEYKENFKREHGVMEGEYDISINGAFLENVPVKAGHSTRILMGALHSTAPYAQQLHILDSKDRRVGAIQGGETIALPIGTYHLKVGTRTVNVEVKENEVTEF